MSTRFADSNPSGCDGIPGLVAGTAAAI